MPKYSVENFLQLTTPQAAPAGTVAIDGSGVNHTLQLVGGTTYRYILPFNSTVLDTPDALPAGARLIDGGNIEHMPAMLNDPTVQACGGLYGSKSGQVFSDATRNDDETIAHSTDTSVPVALIHGPQGYLTINAVDLSAWMAKGYTIVGKDDH